MSDMCCVRRFICVYLRIALFVIVDQLTVYCVVPPREKTREGSS